ncbi:MAG: L-seryl-tRNA(Sec) selenium transferase [Herpetosiphonaceae bacterium]|nr:L-seryl-tRNA(Sec) selenium transferase [Herpetosiphonaceae bacterium]
MYRTLPSVETLLGTLPTDLPRTELVEIARAVLAEARTAIQAGKPAPTLTQLGAMVARRSAALTVPSLQSVINATGVILHTNLGRAPLSAAALQAIRNVAGGYSNLEYDLEAGTRGGRYMHVTALLARLTGAQAALAVNNNAAAVLFVLSCFCAGREVIVSRGQAVEIGGGFRIPDVLRQSGARLVEVGTTNRTYARDYETAITTDTAAILTVHRSNFQISGFTHDPHDQELRVVARTHNILWIDDWGSGSLLQPGDYGLPHEATIPDRVSAGCDLVCFSGDKLLGGPQSGLIAGHQPLIDQLHGQPMLRALRVDKLTLAGLEATLLSYLRGQAPREIPVWQMISTPSTTIKQHASALAAALQQHGLQAEVVACESTVGGGSLPTETLPSWAVACRGSNLNGLAQRLRHGSPPVVGRIADERLLLDLRTVLPEQHDALLEAVVAASAEG